MSPRRPTTLRVALELALVFAAHLGGANLGLLAAQEGTANTLIWPPTGIAVAALYLIGPRVVWAVLASLFVLHFAQLGAPVWASAIMSLGGAAAPMLLTLLLKKRGFHGGLARRGDVILLLAGTAVTMALPAVVGTVIGLARGFLPPHLIATSLIAWWFAECLGVLTVGAALLTSPVPQWREGSRLERLLLYVSTAIIGVIVFVVLSLPIAFVTAGPLLWAGLRFPPRDATRMVLIVGALAAVGAAVGAGPFLRAEPIHTMLYLAAYLLTVSILSLVLGALIAEWRRAQEARRKSEERRIAALVAGALGTYDWELGQLLNLDEGHLRLWGMTPEEFDGTIEAFARRVHPADLPKLMRVQREAREKRTPYRTEYRVIPPDGTHRWIETRGHYTFDAEGVVVGVTGVVQDISARKNAELALAVAHERLRLALDHGRMGIWDVDIGDPRAREELLAQLEPEDRPTTEAALLRCLEGEPFRAELRMRAPDGAHRWQSIFGAPHRNGEGGVRLVGVVHDITERKQAEETRARLERQLREAQKMEAIGTLAGGIAHDFNNILGAVLGNVDLMRDDLDPSHPAWESLLEVRQASLRARDLVRQILAFSRRGEAPRRAMAMGPVIDEAVRLIRASLPRTVTIEARLEESCPPVVADASQLHQVVLNLGTNAFQSMPRRDGRIDVELEAVLVEATLAERHPDLRPGRWVRLAVRDTGAGMDAATRERIFEPFFTTKAPGEGTGLGLAVVHGIVKAHGGAVVVDSELGQGTTFAIYLPIAEVEHEPAAAPAPRVPRGRGERVLFVDDEPALVAIGVRALSRLGYKVTGAVTPAEALDVARADPSSFDALVTDFTMPGMTGLELGAELLKLSPRLPMILLSGYGGGTGPENAAAIGFRDMVVKPVSTEQLAHALRKAIDAGG